MNNQKETIKILEVSIEDGKITYDYAIDVNIYQLIGYLRIALAIKEREIMKNLQGKKEGGFHNDN